MIPNLYLRDSGATAAPFRYSERNCLVLYIFFLNFDVLLNYEMLLCIGRDTESMLKENILTFEIKY